jgi:hypothetical protein
MKPDPDGGLGMAQPEARVGPREVLPIRGMEQLAVSHGEARHERADGHPRERQLLVAGSDRLGRGLQRLLPAATGDPPRLAARDRSHPRSRPARLVARVPPPQRAHEGLLGRVLGVRAAAEYPLGLAQAQIAQGRPVPSIPIVTG